MEPVTFRPQGARVVVYACTVALVVTTVVIGASLPEEITFTVAELVTLALTLGAMIAVLHGIGRSYVRAGDDGVEVLNGYRRHRIEWLEVDGISLRTGAPWPTLVTMDDDRVILFAIQSSDGSVAQHAVDEILRRRRSR